MIDDCEHLRPRAVVARQREQRLGTGAALAEDLHVGVAEAVDRLELVADEEPLRVRPGQEVDQLALKPVRVLELVDHDRAESQPLSLAQALVVAQQVTRVQLQILEVERRLAILRRRVLGGESVQELLQQIAILQRQLVERRLLDRLPRVLIARGSLAARPEAAEVEQPLGQRLGLGERDSLRRRRPRRVGRVRIGSEGACGLSQVIELRLEVGPLSQLEVELPAGGAEGLVDARQHPPQPAGAVGGEQLQPRPDRRRRRTRSAPPRTPRRGSHGPGCRRGCESAGRGRLQRGGTSAAAGRSRGWSRSRRRRASGPGRGVRARAGARGSGP